MDFSIADKAERWGDFWASVQLLSPEIVLVLAMCGVILVPFIRRDDTRLPLVVTVAGLLLALLAAWAPWIGREVTGPDQRPVTEYVSTLAASTTVFADTLAIDPFGQFFKLLLFAFTLLVVFQWRIARRDQCAALDTPDFFCLLLGATFGMSLMASANNLLTILIATESASLPSFALAGFRKHTKAGTEGALKYVVFGAASSAIMIYGMSLIYGATGTLSLSGIAAQAAQMGVASGETTYPLLAVGLMAMLAGLAFKLSAVPLHFWCPDVFQAAPISVTTFLSVASKGAAVILLARVLHAFGAAGEAAGLFTGVAVGVGILGAVTATWGNLVAFHQNNFKRLLAYSSIAHAGYMIMGASVMIWPGKAGDDAANAILFYLLVYMFMNMGAFTVVALVAERTGSEDVRDYAGLIHRSPALAVVLVIFLLSLFGMPGLGGFLGKVYLMKAMIAIGPGGFALLAALLLNTLISLYFYMRPVYYMVFVRDEQDRPSFALSRGLAVLALCVVALVWTGLDLGASRQTRGFTGIASIRVADGPATTPTVEAPAKPDAPAGAE